MPNDLLPERFSDLEPFVAGWSLSSSAERYRKRLSSTMEEIKSFYDAIVPRMGEIVGYLNQYRLDELPDEAQRLSDLTLSLAEIAPAVELFGQPSVIEGLDPARLVPVAVPHMTPAEA